MSVLLTFLRNSPLCTKWIRYQNDNRYPGYLPVVICHDDVIKWKHFPRYLPFVRGIHRSPVNSPHKGQWRGVLKFSLICARINGWVNNREAGDLRRHQAHCDVIVMLCQSTACNGLNPLWPKNTIWRRWWWSQFIRTMVCWQLVPRYYLNTYWPVNWSLKNKLQWNFKLTMIIFINENSFQNVVCEAASIC